MINNMQWEQRRNLILVCQVQSMAEQVVSGKVREVERAEGKGCEKDGIQFLQLFIFQVDLLIICRFL